MGLESTETEKNKLEPVHVLENVIVRALHFLWGGRLTGGVLCKGLLTGMAKNRGHLTGVAINRGRAI